MQHTRTLLLGAGLALATALVPGCDRGVTAPQLGRGQADLSGATEQQVGDGPGGGSATAIMPVVGGRIDLAAGPGDPVDCTLEVPDGAVDVPTTFQLTHASAAGELAVHVAGRSADPQAEPQAFGDDPILLALTYTGSEGTQDVTVEFSPPDGSETVVTRVTLSAGRATVLAYRRGRSKYSVIIF